MRNGRIACGKCHKEMTIRNMYRVRAGKCGVPAIRRVYHCSCGAKLRTHEIDDEHLNFLWETFERINKENAERAEYYQARLERYESPDYKRQRHQIRLLIQELQENLKSL